MSSNTSVEAICEFKKALALDDFLLAHKFLSNKSVNINDPILEDFLLYFFQKNDYPKIVFISYHDFDIFKFYKTSLEPDRKGRIFTKYLIPINIVDQFSKSNERMLRDLCIFYLAEQMLDKCPTLDCIKSMPTYIFGSEYLLKKMDILGIEYKTFRKYIEFLSMKFLREFYFENLHEMKNILELGHDINMCYSGVFIDNCSHYFSGTVIEMAIQRISPEIIQFLLDNGANTPIELLDKLDKLFDNEMVDIRNYITFNNHNGLKCVTIIILETLKSTQNAEKYQSLIEKYLQITAIREEVLWQLRKPYIFLTEGLSYYPNHILFYFMNEFIVKEVSSFSHVK
jgi:hypothetical protein